MRLATYTFITLIKLQLSLYHICIIPVLGSITVFLSHRWKRLVFGKISVRMWLTFLATCMCLICHFNVWSSPALVVLIAAFALAEGALRAAKKLHQDLLVHGLRSPMSFFDSTPVGRILNRFSKDIDVIDTTIPSSLDSWCKCTLAVMGTLFVISFSTPLFLVVIVPMGIIYYLIQVIMMAAFVRANLLSHYFKVFCGMFSNFFEQLHDFNATIMNFWTFS